VSVTHFCIDPLYLHRCCYAAFIVQYLDISVVCYKERNSLAHTQNLTQPLKRAQAVTILTCNRKVKPKGKIYPITGHKGPEEK